MSISRLIRDTHGGDIDAARALLVHVERTGNEVLGQWLLDVCCHYVELYNHRPWKGPFHKKCLEWHRLEGAAFAGKGNPIGGPFYYATRDLPEIPA